MIDPHDRVSDPCPTGCGHPFHGLPCIYTTGNMAHPICKCPGPWGTGTASERLAE